jgi:hypothetical protein
MREVDQGIASSNTPGRALAIIPWVSLILGGVLWFGLCTDWSWNSFWANTCYPPLVGIIGGVSLASVLRQKQQRSRVIACLPAVIGGLPYIVIPVLAVILCWPAAAGFALYDIGEEMTRACIEQAASPDGSRIAEVHYLTLDPSHERGRIEIRVKYRWLPFVIREIHAFGSVAKDTRDYLRWQDNNSLHVFERKAHAYREVEIEIGWIGWTIPFVPSHLQ